MVVGRTGATAASSSQRRTSGTKRASATAFGPIDQHIKRAAAASSSTAAASSSTAAAASSSTAAAASSSTAATASSSAATAASSSTAASSTAAAASSGASSIAAQLAAADAVVAGKLQRRGGHVKVVEVSASSLFESLMKDHNNKCPLCPWKRNPTARNDNQLRHFNQSTDKNHVAIHDAMVGSVKRKLAFDAAYEAVTKVVAQLKPASVFIQKPKRVEPDAALTTTELAELAGLEKDVAVALALNNCNIAAAATDTLEFKALGQILGYKMSGRAFFTDLRREIMGVTRADLLHELPLNIINVTTDMWNATGTPWLAVTAHGVRDFEMYEVLVGLIDTGVWRKGADEMYEVAQWLINSRLPAGVVQFVATADNTASAVSLAHKLSGNDGTGFGCACHLINLAVRKTLLAEKVPHGLDELYELVARCREAVVYAKKHELFGELRDLQLRRGVLAGHVQAPQKDNDTRWHSTRDMIASVVALQQDFRQLDDVVADEDGENLLLLSEAELITANQLTAILDDVAVASRTLEASHTPTMPIVSRVITDLLRALDKVHSARVARPSVLNFVMELKVELFLRFEKALTTASWPTTAALLSPFHCALDHLKDDEQRYRVMRDIKLSLLKFNDFVDPIPDDASDDAGHGSDAFGDIRSMRDLLSRTRDDVLTAGLRAISNISKGARERMGADNYSRLVIHDRDADLRFWRLVHEGKRDELADLLRIEKTNDEQKKACEKLLEDNLRALQALWQEFGQLIGAVLSVQASSAACERVFSEAKWLLQDYSGDDIKIVEDAIRVRQQARKSFSDKDECVEFARKLARRILIHRRPQ